MGYVINGNLEYLEFYCIDRGKYFTSPMTMNNEGGGGISGREREREREKLTSKVLFTNNVDC